MRALLWLVSALWAAVISDALVEALENAGLFGALRDDDHQSLLPALILACLSVAIAAIVVAILRRRGHDPLLLESRRMRRKGMLADVLVTFCLTAATVAAMEEYERFFGGASPFAAHGLLATHGLVVLATYFVIAALFIVSSIGLVRKLADAADRTVRCLVSWLAAVTQTARQPKVVYTSRRGCGELRLPALHVGFRACDRAPPLPS